MKIKHCNDINIIYSSNHILVETELQCMVISDKYGVISNIKTDNVVFKRLFSKKIYDILYIITVCKKNNKILSCTKKEWYL